MHRRLPDGHGNGQKGDGTLSFPEAPASTMSSIPQHANIARENLAEECGLLHLPPLAIRPGEPNGEWRILQHSNSAVGFLARVVRISVMSADTAIYGSPLYGLYLPN